MISLTSISNKRLRHIHTKAAVKQKTGGRFSHRAKNESYQKPKQLMANGRS